VVEDDESLRILIQRKLNRAGFFSELISNGTDALAKITDHEYCLILLDYTLPDMSGTQFVMALTELNHDIPFIVCTGQENETIVDEMMDLGAREYVIKDNRFLDSILHSVQSVLG
jgi:DNA-binding NtrC family response regulator